MYIKPLLFLFFLSFLFSLSSVSMVLYICRAGGARDHCKSGTNKDTLPWSVISERDAFLTYLPIHISFLQWPGAKAEKPNNNLFLFDICSYMVHVVFSEMAKGWAENPDMVIYLTFWNLVLSALDIFGWPSLYSRSTTRRSTLGQFSSLVACEKDSVPDGSLKRSNFV
jgi:hypothetical protein